MTAGILKWDQNTKRCFIFSKSSLSIKQLAINSNSELHCYLWCDLWFTLISLSAVMTGHWLNVRNRSFPSDPNPCLISRFSIICLDPCHSCWSQFVLCSEFRCSIACTMMGKVGRHCWWMGLMQQKSCVGATPLTLTPWSPRQSLMSTLRALTTICTAWELSCPLISWRELWHRSGGWGGQGDSSFLMFAKL